MNVPGLLKQNFTFWCTMSITIIDWQSEQMIRSYLYYTHLYYALFQSSSLFVIYWTSYNPFLRKCIIKHFFLRSGKNIIREGQEMGGFLISKTFSIYCHYVISCLFPDDGCVFQKNVLCNFVFLHNRRASAP